MSFFSSKPKNRRRRARKTTGKEPWIEGEKSAKPKRKKSKDVVGQVYELNAQIGVIENFLARKTAEQTYREQMRRDGLIPPPDRAQLRRSKKKAALSHAQRRRQNAERSRNGLHFLFLFCLACGIIWWLLNSGI